MGGLPILQDKFIRDSYITRSRQYIICKTIQETVSIKEAAEKLNLTPHAVYVTRRKTMQIIERTLRTLEVAMELNLLEEERIKKICHNHFRKNQ
ncbi:MAG: hypothetical protein ACTSYQ_02220 [Candidatus Odinarchaeia archaeon]